MNNQREIKINNKLFVFRFRLGNGKASIFHERTTKTGR